MSKTKRSQHSVPVSHEPIPPSRSGIDADANFHRNASSWQVDRSLSDTRDMSRQAGRPASAPQRFVQCRVAMPSKGYVEAPRLFTTAGHPRLFPNPYGSDPEVFFETQAQAERRLTLRMKDYQMLALPSVPIPLVPRKARYTRGTDSYQLGFSHTDLGGLADLCSKLNDRFTDIWDDTNHLVHDVDIEAKANNKANLADTMHLMNVFIEEIALLNRAATQQEAMTSELMLAVRTISDDVNILLSKEETAQIAEHPDPDSSLMRVSTSELSDIRSDYRILFTALSKLEEKIYHLQLQAPVRGPEHFWGEFNSHRDRVLERMSALERAVLLSTVPVVSHTPPGPHTSEIAGLAGRIAKLEAAQLAPPITEPEPIHVKPNDLPPFFTRSAVLSPIRQAETARAVPSIAVPQHPRNSVWRAPNFHYDPYPRRMPAQLSPNQAQWGPAPFPPPPPNMHR